MVLVQLLRHALPFSTLHQRDPGHGVTVFQGGYDAKTARYPLFSFTASDAAASRDRFALAIASLCAFAAVTSSPPVIGSAFATLPVLWSTMTSENFSPFIV